MTDLQELFSRDPLSLTRDDLTVIIEEFRKSRHAFNMGNMKAGSTKPPTEKQKALTELSKNLGISI